MIVLAVIGEDATHAAVVDGLVRQTVRDVAATAGSSWLVDLFDDGYAPLQWVGEQDLSASIAGLRYFNRSDANRLGESLGGSTLLGGRPIKLRGFIDGRSQKGEAHAWRIRLVGVLADDRVAAVIAAKDTDGDPASLDGLRQAAASISGRLVIVCAPHQDAEAWLVLGLAGSPHLTAITRALGFDPTREPHRLTGSPNAAATDAKRVLRRLLFDEDRSGSLTVAELAAHRDACLPGAATIKSHGTDCGIAAFCDAIRRDIAPLFDPALSVP